jgi:hypothetical protein
MSTVNLFKAQRLQAEIKNNNHILHLLLSLITAGLWVPVWILCCVNRGMTNASIRRQIVKLENTL